MPIGAIQVDHQPAPAHQLSSPPPRTQLRPARARIQEPKAAHSRATESIRRGKAVHRQGNCARQAEGRCIWISKGLLQGLLLLPPYPAPVITSAGTPTLSLSLQVPDTLKTPTGGSKERERKVRHRRAGPGPGPGQTSCRHGASSPRRAWSWIATAPKNGSRGSPGLCV